jgi:hypothetical protein
MTPAASPEKEPPPMEVKGTTVLPLKAFVRERFTDRYDEWFQTLPADSRKILEWCLASDWYPIGPAYLEPTRLIVDRFYAGRERGAWDIGRFSADYALKGFLRIFMRIGSPQFSLSRGLHIFSQYYRDAHIHVAEVGKNACLIRIDRFPGIHPFVEQRVAGWIERAVEICGRKPLRVEIAKSMAKGADVTEFDVAWD